MKDDAAFRINYQSRLAWTIKLQDLIGQKSSVFICGPDCLDALRDTMGTAIEIQADIKYLPHLKRYVSSGPHTSWALMSGIILSFIVNNLIRNGPPCSTDGQNLP